MVALPPGVAILALKPLTFCLFLFVPSSVRRILISPCFLRAAFAYGISDSRMKFSAIISRIIVRRI